MLFARPQCACVFVHVFMSLFVCAVVVFSSKQVVVFVVFVVVVVVVVVVSVAVVLVVIVFVNPRNQAGNLTLLRLTVTESYYKWLHPCAKK